MATSWDIVVVGGANSDFLIRGSALPRPGETIEGDSFQEAAGGKGANQAVAAARLGKRVAFVARMGDDSRADELLAQLQSERVDVSQVVRDPQEPTGAALIQVDAQGHKQIMTAPGANQRLSVSDVEAAAAAIRGCRVLLLQLEVPLPAVETALSIARAAKVRTVLDPAPARPLPDDVLQMVDVVRPNSSEAEVLTGIEVTDRQSARRAAEELRRRGSRVAVVQAGGEGNVLVSDEGEIWLPHFPVKSVDQTGAGDAFAAGLAIMFSEGRPWSEAGSFASAVAAISTTQIGAQAGLPDRRTVEKFLAEQPAASR
jgi:ribokinase